MNKNNKNEYMGHFTLSTLIVEANDDFEQASNNWAMKIVAQERLGQI